MFILVILSIPVLTESIHSERISYFLDDKTLYKIAGHNSSGEAAGITIGSQPSNLESWRGKIYVTNNGDDTVSVIDVVSNKKIEPDIAVGQWPEALVAYKDKLFVGNQDSDTVSVIDVVSNKKIEPDIAVGQWPNALVKSDQGTFSKIFVANSGSGTVSVINATDNTRIEPDITVGESPSTMVAYDDKIYVANNFDKSISVINATDNTRIEPDIKVGQWPEAMVAYEDAYEDKIYVANSGSGTVSVINATDNTRIEPDIKVGEGPSAMVDFMFDDPSGEGGGGFDKIYVANSGSDTVSVINATDNTRIEPDITVGENPISMLIEGDSLYVTNYDSDSLSVIQVGPDRAVAKLMFNTHPFNYGYIDCGKENIKAPLGQEFYLYIGDQCIARAYDGHEFVSWQENLDKNSTQILKSSAPSSTLESFVSLFDWLPDKPESKLNITKFGNFTATFRPLPPPIPPEFTATLFAVVASAFIGSFLTPAFIGWRKIRNQGKKLDFYHKQIELFDDNNISNDKETGTLKDLDHRITNEYLRGKINKEQFDKLMDDISISYRNAFSNKLDSLKELPEDEREKQLSKVKNNIEDLRYKEKISQEQFEDLKIKISVLYEEIFTDQINLIGSNDKEKIKEIENNIKNSYSKGKINELHYNMLMERMQNLRNGEKI